MDFDIEEQLDQLTQLNESSFHVLTDPFDLNCRPNFKLARFTLGYIGAIPSRSGPGHSHYMASSDCTDECWSSACHSCNLGYLSSPQIGRNSCLHHFFLEIYEDHI